MSDTPIRNNDFTPMLREIEIKFYERPENGFPNWAINAFVAVALGFFLLMAATG